MITGAEVPSHMPPETEVWQDRPYALRKLLGAGALALGIGVAGGGLAAASYAAFTPTSIEIGPHSATARATIDNKINFDVGPLGNADKPTGWGLGVNVDVKGIPVPPDQSALASAGTVLAQYQQLYVDPAHIKANAIRTVVSRIENDAIVGGAIGGVAGIGMFASKRRRKYVTEQNMQVENVERSQALAELETMDLPEKQKQILSNALQLRTSEHASKRRQRTVAVFATLLLAGACSSDYAHTTDVDNPAISHALDGTPFEGFAIHGEVLRLVVDEAAPQIIQIVRSNQGYYKQAAAHFDSAFDALVQQAPLNHEDYIYILNISDNHCNIGMNKVHGAIAKKFKADGIIDGGDMTMGGTAAEEECVAAETDAFRDLDVPKALAAGNHDSPTIERIAAKHGMEPLHLNKIVTIAGLRVMGESDVNESTFGTPLHLRGSETVAQETERITKAACAEKPDILVVHEPEMTTPAITNGCAPLSISGHKHTFHAPRLLNAMADSYQFVEGTSGGAKEGSITVGELKQDAVETVLVFSKASKRLAGYYKITIRPDKTVVISGLQELEPTTSANDSPPR